MNRILSRSLVMLAIFSAGCSSIRSAAELAPDEKGAACIHIQAESINPFINGTTRAAILEINTGNPDEVISADLIAATAEAMGCR